MTQNTAIIIGAGPAGLTAAYELLTKTAIRPVIYEMTGDIGGISKTVNYKGNRIDIGGHRFFSRSDAVIAWWQDILPLQGAPARDGVIQKGLPALSRSPGEPDPEKIDHVMLMRDRASRIFFLGSLYDYPISMKYRTFKNLGLTRAMRTGLSYAKAAMLPIRNEESLEDFLINRYGRELYHTFFKDYAEKVWGVSCREIPPDWWARRPKGLSMQGAPARPVKNTAARDAFLTRKDAETSLIGQFMYPKLGPGQLWEEVARRVVERGGAIHLKQKVIGLDTLRGRILAARILDTETNEVSIAGGDYFFSTMPVSELIGGMNPAPPGEVRSVAQGLVYRDFITVGLLVKKLGIKKNTGGRGTNGAIPYDRIYVQEQGVRLGRLQIFNNWSPYLVKDPGTVWLGLDYFCLAGDDLWSKPEHDLAAFAAGELAGTGMIDPRDVLDHVVIRMPKTHPACFGTYSRFGVIRDYADSFGNLFLIGRNGMHKNNTAGHSMLTAMAAVENILEENPTKGNLWTIDAKEDYLGPKEG